VHQYDGFPLPRSTIMQGYAVEVREMAARF